MGLFSGNVTFQKFIALLFVCCTYKVHCEFSITRATHIHHRSFRGKKEIIQKEKERLSHNLEIITVIILMCNLSELSL